MKKRIVYSEEEVLHTYTQEVEAETADEAVEIARNEWEWKLKDEYPIEITDQYAEQIKE